MKTQSFEEFKQIVLKSALELNEMAIAGEGDWVDNKAFGFITSKVLKLKYTFSTNIKIKNETYAIYEMDRTNNKVFVVGKIKNIDDDNKLAIIGSIELRKIPDFMDLHNVWNVDDVRVEELFQGQGIAKSIYLYLVKDLRMILLGDEVQYFGARSLWSRLSKLNNVIVDIIDIIDNSYISKNVEVHQGLEDADFDKRVWSRDEKLAHVRLILKDIR